MPFLKTKEVDKPGMLEQCKARTEKMIYCSGPASLTDSSVWPDPTSIFLPEKRRHLLLSSSEQQQLEATDLLQIDLLDSSAVLCYVSASPSFAPSRLALTAFPPDASHSVSEWKCYSGESKTQSSDLIFSVAAAESAQKRGVHPQSRSIQEQRCPTEEA